MAYILIDDICELAMKSWLQRNVRGWMPVSHRHNDRDYYKSFWTIVSELRNANSDDSELEVLLHRVEGRREQRNHFFHNQELSGLTVVEEECLRAFCDLYDLSNRLFGCTYRTSLESNGIVRAQIALIRLMHASYSAHWISDQVSQVLSSQIMLQPGSLGYNYRAIYDDPHGLVTTFEPILAAL